ncbi:MAG: secondary thiamine-phosphate synthase enzyme YjbQ [Oligoflexia bacterium]|nr:secondary thiamine-phosphate synthase enzyme YjbQ [Oligoflexia bacterium]
MLKPTDWLLEPHSCPGFLRTELKAHVERTPYVHHTEHVLVHLPKRYALVNINGIVEEALERSEVRDGFCFVSAMHITAGVYINDAESGLLQDISEWIEHLAPFGKNYRHHQTGEDNADAHLKSYLTNHALSVPVRDGKFDFGPWQQIFYAEFDGRRDKKILVKVTGFK